MTDTPATDPEAPESFTPEYVAKLRKESADYRGKMT
jgi:hypothetical protein